MVINIGDGLITRVRKLWVTVNLRNSDKPQQPGPRDDLLLARATRVVNPYTRVPYAPSYTSRRTVIIMQHIVIMIFPYRPFIVITVNITI